MNTRNKHGMGRRNSGARGICLAAMLAITAAPAVAQDISEFEDPLAEMRAKIEQVESGAAATLADATGDTAALASSVGANSAASTTPDVNDPLSRISERLGLPVLGLVALAGLALLALLLGLMWLVTRIRGRHAAKLVDRELYAVDDGARGRRELQSGVMAKRGKAASETKPTQVEKRAVPSAAAAAAAIISDDVDHEQDDYDLPESEEPAKTTFGKVRKAEEAPVDTDATDPSSWRRPNLDRLKASIREDWQGDKDEQAERAAAMAAAGTTAAAGATVAAISAVETSDLEAQGAETASDEVRQPEEAMSPLRREAENFASLFGDDDPAPAVNDDAESYFSEGLGTPKGDDRTMFSDLRSTIEKTADISPPEALEKRRAELPSRDDAMRRIRALRESVKAS